MSTLAPAEHRALRELYATAERLRRHWAKLGVGLGGDTADVLSAGAAEAGALVGELRALTEPYGLYGRSVAEGAGRMLSALGEAADHTLERNQALRVAVLHATHLVLLLGYLERLARARDDAEMAVFHTAWGARMAAVEQAARTVAVEVGHAPETAVDPARPGPAGRAGHAFGLALGTMGEWVDRRLAHPR